MSENIDIKIREDGSRVVSRNLDDIANSADKADKSVKDVNKTLGETAKTSSGLDRLRKALDQTNISLQQAFDSSRVERFNQGLVQYRNGLMKHFEMIAKGARASAAAIKSQMDAMTTKTPALSALAEYYGEQEKAHADSVNASAKYLAEQEAMEKASAARRLGVIVENMSERRAVEESYGAFWKKELDARDKLEQQAVASTVRSMKVQEEAESRSNQQRLKYASQAIAERMKAESAYTTWWITEMKKRDAATAANNLTSAQQRSGMQTVNSERLSRQLVKGPNAESALYTAAEAGNGAKSSLQTMELQAMQRQMAMMQLLAPMAQRQLDIDKEADGVTRQHTSAKSALTSTNGKLASSTSTASSNQRQWNEQARDAHALARGLSGSLGQLWLTYGSILPLLTGAALGSAFVGAAKSGSELAYQLTFVKALGGESAEAVSKLKDQAHELGTQGVFGPKELASGYRVLAQAGMDATQSLALMPDVLNLATVGELKMDQAGLAIVGTLNAFKLGVEQSGAVSDMFAKAAAVSQSSVEDLTQAMRYASTTSTQYKQSLEDTMTALTLLAKVNITGTSAGTAYRNMLKEIYTPTEKAKKAWSELGIKMTEVVDGKEKVRGFVDIMYDLQKVMLDSKTGYTEKGQMGIIGDLFGERGSKEAAEMLTIIKAKWMDLRDEIANSKGFGQGVADQLNESVKVSWQAALNTLESELEKAFDNMENGFGQFAKTLKELFQSDDFRSTLNGLVEGVVTLGNALLTAAPYLLDFAKAWLVLKAAQAGASIAALMLGAATAAQAVAAGMLAASGAMGPVARGASMLAPLLGALGGPLGIILTLLSAGAAAWALWGDESKKAMDKAGQAAQTASDNIHNMLEQQSVGFSLNSQSWDLAGLKALKARTQLETEIQKQINGLNESTNAGYTSSGGKVFDRANKDVTASIMEGKGWTKDVANLLKTYDSLTGDIKTANANMADAVAAEGKAKATLANANASGAGPKSWVPPKKDPAGANSGPSGRLNKDDNALAKLQAQLLASEKEYAVISMTGDAQFKLNEGQTKSLEIQQKIEELQSKSLVGLKEKGIKGHQEQLASLQEQLVVSNKLGEQLQANELLKVNNKLDEEIRLTKLIPDLRETENKYIQYRNELLGKGVVMDEAAAAALRQRIEDQNELNKVSGYRDQFIKNGSNEQGLNTDRQLKGLQDAHGSAGWTQGDTASASDSMLKAMGFDTANTQTAIDAQIAQVQRMYATLDKMKAAQTINQQTYDQLTTQAQLKEFDIRTAGTKQFFGYMTQLSTSKNKELAAIGKAAAITQAIIDTYKMATSAYSSMSGIPYVGPALGAAAAAAAVAAGMANVDKIRSTNANFATGGSFVVGGSGGVDSQQVSMRASPGEKVTVSTPTQVRKGDELNKKNQQNSSGTSNNDSIKIINMVDPNMLQDFLSTPAGERVLVNTIQRNSGAIRSVMNG